MKKLVAAMIVSLCVVGAPRAEEGHSLKDVMKHLGMEMRDISDGLLNADYERLARAAQTIAEHSHMSSQEHRRIESTLGKDMARFRQVDERVHHTAMELADAARAKNTSLSLTRYAELMEGCVACHNDFRERLRRR